MGGNTSKKTSRRALASAGGLVIALVAAGTFGAGGAWAGTSDGASVGTSDSSEQSCLVSIDGSRTCFDTPEEAWTSALGSDADAQVIDSATSHDHTSLDALVNTHNDKVAKRLASATVRPLAAAPEGALSTPAAQTDSLSSLAVASSVEDGPLLGALWKDKNYKGTVQILYGLDGSGCYGSTTYGFPSMRKVGMNDSISSLAGYYGCATTLYKDDNYKGTSLTIQSASAYVGNTMNDKTSSIVFRPRT